MEAQPTLALYSYILPCKPVLKWAGGKTQLLRQLRMAMPRQFNRYIEPFLGGGALFFDLARTDAIAADSNSDLVEFYEVVRDNADGLLEAVSQMVTTKDEYYNWRAIKPLTLSKEMRAARFLYLNKTCYNGLHRVNKKGDFNTPYGGRDHVNIADAANLYHAATILRNADLRCATYEETLAAARPGDFVYLDPPYLPLGGYSDFRRYTKDFFQAEDHVRLAKAFQDLTGRGVLALLSNSDNPVIEKLYSGCHIRRVKASRQINCQASGRGQITELLISNYSFETEHVLS